MMKSRGRELTRTADPRLFVHPPIGVTGAVHYDGEVTRLNRAGIRE